MVDREELEDLHRFLAIIAHSFLIPSKASLWLAWLIGGATLPDSRL
jgi:hypothetical protein